MNYFSNDTRSRPLSRLITIVLLAMIVAAAAVSWTIIPTGPVAMFHSIGSTTAPARLNIGVAGGPIWQSADDHWAVRGNWLLVNVTRNSSGTFSFSYHPQRSLLKPDEDELFFDRLRMIQFATPIHLTTTQRQQLASLKLPDVSIGPADQKRIEDAWRRVVSSPDKSQLAAERAMVDVVDAVGNNVAEPTRAVLAALNQQVASIVTPQQVTAFQSALAAQRARANRGPARGLATTRASTRPTTRARGRGQFPATRPAAGLSTTRSAAALAAPAATQP
jgi:hypothetical protein